MSFLRNLGVVAIGVVTALLFVFAVNAAPPAAAPHEITWEDLIAMCESAKTDFRLLTRDDLKPIVTELKDAAGRLDAWLKVAGPHAPAWRKFLMWDALRQQLQGPGLPDREVLWEVYQRYISGHEGLTLVWFADVRQALLRYVEAAGTIDNAEIKPGYEKQLAHLVDLLKTYREKPTPELAAAISKAVRWLQSTRQAPQLVSALEERFGQPNLLAEASAEVVNAGLTEPVDETRPVEDCILGTAIYGTGRTVGETQAVLTDGDGYGTVDDLLLSKTYTDTIGYHGPVRIYSTGVTRIGSVKRLWVNAEGVFTHPAMSNAVTCSSINDIQSRRGRRLVERFAWRKAMKQLDTAEWIAARHAESRANRRIDSQAAENLAQANDKYQQKFRRPLVEHKLFPNVFHVSSDSRAIRIKSLLRGATLLAAVQPPPKPVPGDLVLCVHESMINNFAQDALGGMTVHEDRFQKSVVDIFGELPKKMKTEEKEEPWVITFAEDQPIFVRFDDNCFSVTIRGNRYQRGDKSVDRMAVTAKYTIQKTESGFEAVRDKNLEIVPKEYGLRRGPAREVFINRFEKIFDEKIRGEGFALQGRWKKAGKFIPLQFTCRDGWLVLAWKREPLPGQETSPQASPPIAAEPKSPAKEHPDPIPPAALAER